jgi:phosphoribosylformimino-5-aminoimidazole carboxamide ribotide isomerase
MRIIPAIDVLEGNAVRLTKGDYDAVTVYSSDPGAIAREWSEAGAALIHVVDLEAARSGRRSADVLRAVVQSGVAVQLGGGIRSANDAIDVIDAGVARVVIGSVLVADEQETGRIVRSVGPDRVVAAIDVRGGRAMGSGWLDDGVELSEMAARIRRSGITAALVTGIERDGTMQGPDLELLREARAMLPGVELIASGGVGALDDLDSLASLPDVVDGAIVGRALYEGRFTLEQALDQLGPT